MFSYACNLLKMDASSTDFEQCFKKYLARNTSRSDQIQADQIVDQIRSDADQCECS